MATPVRQWTSGSISIAVESGKDDANRESVHVHVYKNGRRTDARISLRDSSSRGIDNQDFEIAGRLFDDNLNEIQREYEKVKNGNYGD